MGSSHIVDIDSDEDTFLSDDGEASGRAGTSEGLALLMFYNVAPNRHGEAGVRFLSIPENTLQSSQPLGLLTCQAALVLQSGVCLASVAIALRPLQCMQLGWPMRGDAPTSV